MTGEGVYFHCLQTRHQIVLLSYCCSQRERLHLFAFPRFPNLAFLALDVNLPCCSASSSGIYFIHSCFSLHQLSIPCSLPTPLICDVTLEIILAAT